MKPSGGWKTATVAWTVALVPFWAVLWLLLLNMPEEAAGAGLDPAWRALVAHDWLGGVRAGVEAVFTYGPLAYFVEPQAGYVAELFTARLVVELLIKALVAYVLFALGAALAPWQRLLYVLVLIALAPLLKDAVFLLMLCGLPLAVLSGRRVPVPLVLCMLALFSLVKFTFLVLAVPGVLAVAIAAGRRDGVGVGVASALAFPVLIALAWVTLARQSLGDLPAFLVHGHQVAVGYNLTMSLAGDPAILGRALLVLALLGPALLLAALPNDLLRRLGVMVVASALFLSWKAAFVRQDPGHTLMFFPVAVVLGVFLLGMERGVAASARRRVQSALCVAGIGAALIGSMESGADLGYRPAAMRPVLTHIARLNLSGITSPGALRAEREQGLAVLEQELALPRSVALIGDGTTDLIAHEQGILYLNDLNVRHRPVFQGYTSYTPMLQELNGRFYADVDGPDFVFFKLQPTGGYVPTLQDSQALRVLLSHFEPALAEGGYILLRRRVDPPPVVGGSTERVQLELGAWHELEDVDDEPVFASITLQPSLQGRLRTLLFRPSRLSIELRLDDGRQRSFNIAPGIAEAPFLLSPLPLSTLDFLSLYVGGDVPRVEALRISADEPGDYEARIDMELSVGAEPVPGAPLPLPPRLLEHALSAAFPLVDPGAGRLVSVANARHDVVPEGPATYVTGNSRLTLELPAGRHRLTARFAMRADSYKDSARTDGMAFSVVAREPGAPTVEHARRLLRPVEESDDRGLQEFVLSVDLERPATLDLLTDPGPTGHGSWDRAYWRTVHVESLTDA